VAVRRSTPESGSSRHDRTQRSAGGAGGARSRQEFVADAVDGPEVTGRGVVVAGLSAQLDGDLIQRAGGAEIVAAPDFVEEAVARKHLAGVGVKQLQQFQFARGEVFDGVAAAELLHALLFAGGIVGERQAATQG